MQIGRKKEIDIAVTTVKAVLVIDTVIFLQEIKPDANPAPDTIIPTSTKIMNAAVNPKISSGKTLARYENSAKLMSFSPPVCKKLPSAPFAASL